MHTGLQTGFICDTQEVVLPVWLKLMWFGNVWTYSYVTFLPAASLAFHLAGRKRATRDSRLQQDPKKSSPNLISQWTNQPYADSKTSLEDPLSQQQQVLRQLAFCPIFFALNALVLCHSQEVLMIWQMHTVIEVWLDRRWSWVIPLYFERYIYTHTHTYI